MRVLWINHRDIDNPTAGGAERTIFEVGRRLVRRGHEVHLLTGSWRGAPSHSNRGGIDVRRIPGTLIPHLATPAFISAVFRPDVIIDDMAHAIPWCSPWFSRRPGTVFFHHLHARTLPGQVNPVLARVLTRVERGYPAIYPRWPFVAESSSSTNDLITLGISRNRIACIAPGVDTQLFHPVEKTPTPTLVYFAGLRRYKRPEHALLVHKTLTDLGVENKLRVVGSGPATGSVQSIINKLNLHGSVELTGRVDDQTLAGIVGESWINLHTSVAEGWGFSILEAAAAGTPTIAYRVPGVTEAVLENQSGILCENGAAEIMAEACLRVIASPRAWTAASRKWACSFDWDTTARRWEGHLQSLI